MTQIGHWLLLACSALSGCMPTSSPPATSGSGKGAAQSAGGVKGAASVASGPMRIVGYFPDWTYGRKGCEYKVEDVDGALLTHANFAFAKIDPGPDRQNPKFKVAAYDPSDVGAQGQYARFNALKRKHQHLRTFISIGGWSFNETATAWIFTTVAEKPSTRAEFIQSAIAFSREYGFDGVDLDWEYPGEPTRGGRPQDTQNFTALLREFRAAIQDEASKTGKEALLLTMAAPAGPYHFRWLELDKIHESLDWINLMAYDYAGPWDGRTGVNAPFRDLGPGIQGSVSAYINFGVPADKIVVGLATYGRSFGSVDKAEVDTAAKGSGPPARCTQADGMLAYFEVMELIQSGKYKAGWDDASSTPFAYDSAAKVWITYDDEKSITKKVEFIREKKLGGAMFWSLDTDDYHKGYPLVSIAKKLLD
ncbi:MAG TPA: glycosyl hydrolase family 18 protein [Polyangiaceae bacterium]|jgi:chitinase|nr:glycosyl hydrolase family 18 protein [Polyangiaceae bacterium]